MGDRTTASPSLAGAAAVVDSDGLSKCRHGEGSSSAGGRHIGAVETTTSARACETASDR